MVYHSSVLLRSPDILTKIKLMKSLILVLWRSVEPIILQIIEKIRTLLICRSSRRSCYDIYIGSGWNFRRNAWSISEGKRNTTVAIVSEMGGGMQVIMSIVTESGKMLGLPPENPLPAANYYAKRQQDTRMSRLHFQSLSAFYTVYWQPLNSTDKDQRHILRDRRLDTTTKTKLSP
jgi:hypothetical protein